MKTFKNIIKVNYKINELLDEVTKIVFKDISDSLDTSGYKL